MVNIVVRHHHNTSPLQNTKIPRNKSSPSPVGMTMNSSSNSNSRDRMVVPSPVIRVHSYSKRRPLSPLTASESIFGAAAPVKQSRSQSPPELLENHHHRGGGMPMARMEPAGSRDSSMNEQSGGGGDLICDYDQNVTTLYELLESSHWDKARLRCRTHPEEVRTWIVRRDATNNNCTRWKLLPLHAAVIFQSPAPVLESMLLEYPNAAGKRDDQGMLPLHLAFRHGLEECIIELLLEQYPQAVLAKDRRERLPLDHAGDSQFSPCLLRKYAEACLQCQPPPEQPPSSSTSQMEAQIDHVKRNYEDQIAELLRDQELELRLLQQKVDQDMQRIRIEHDQEMDEIRDLLTREVAGGARGRQSEQEVLELQQELSQTKTENQILRGAIQEQTLHYEDLQAHMQKVLEDQKTVEDYCEQQQQDLEEAQLLRDQLLTSLAQKDGSLRNNSREIYQFSKDLRLRTEQILAREAKVPALKERGVVRPEKKQEKKSREWSANAQAQAEDEGEHVDDISAITDDNY